MATRVPQRTYGGVSADERIAARRAKLLDAGLELFGTRGFAATGVKDVCREAGLTDRYFYESFDDRLALFTAVFDRATEDLLQSVAEAVIAGPSELGVLELARFDGDRALAGVSGQGAVAGVSVAAVTDL